MSDYGWLKAHGFHEVGDCWVQPLISVSGSPGFWRAQHTSYCVEARAETAKEAVLRLASQLDDDADRYQRAAELRRSAADSIRRICNG